MSSVELIESLVASVHAPDGGTDGGMAMAAGKIALGRGTLADDACPEWAYLLANDVLAKHANDRARQLAMAGALIVAEMDRLTALEDRG